MISDFGLSKMFNDDEIMKTACGTPGYVGKILISFQLFIDIYRLFLISSRSFKKTRIW
jgi:hypothetical protein